MRICCMHAMTLPVKKYKTGNTRVMIDLGPHYKEFVQCARDVDIPLGKYVKHAALTYMSVRKNEPLLIPPPGFITHVVD